MMEPTLKDISDYNTLKGEKKRVVMAVIVAGVLLGGIYTIAANIYSKPEGSIKVKESVNNVPLR